MTDSDDPAPPDRDAPPPVPRRGAPRAGATPRVETVRLTGADLARRSGLDKTRARLVVAAGAFALLFGAVIVKLADATVLSPMLPRRVEHTIQVPEPTPDGAPAVPDAAAPHLRATITDRNGEILAVSLPTSGLYANPREMMDTADVAHRLRQVLPRLDEETVRTRLGSGKQFVYLARQITPREQLDINGLGIPGIYFQQTERRRYPLGRVAAQVLGGVDVDSHGTAGAERFFDARLRDDGAPLKLSIDVRVQSVMRDELSKAMDEFHAIGACGIVMDVRTGEVIAMVSLPDYDANKSGEAAPEERFNRAVTGMYEPGSTFKLQTAAMALDGGIAQLWNMYDAAHDIHIGRFTITDFEGKHRMLYLPEVLAYSSNLGAAHIAQSVGAERQRAWLQAMGMFHRVGIELPEQGQPIVQPAANWKEIATMTVGFGHGIAISPLHVVRGTAAIANGGVLVRPTIVAQEGPRADEDSVRVMKESTSDIMRKLMRLVVTDGYGKPADVPGYFVGGKTGTAEKTSGHGYKKHANVSAFMSVFPMNAPRYAVYFMLDEPHGNASTGGYSTAGAVSAPAAGRVIARIGPMLGMVPQTAQMAAIQATLAIALQPGHPAGRPVAPAGSPVAPAGRPIAQPREPTPTRREASATPHALEVQ